MWFFRPAACFSFTDSLYNTPTSLTNRNNHIHNIQPDIRLSVKDFFELGCGIFIEIDQTTAEIS